MSVGDVCSDLVADVQDLMDMLQFDHLEGDKRFTLTRVYDYLYDAKVALNNARHLADHASL